MVLSVLEPEPQFEGLGGGTFRAGGEEFQSLDGKADHCDITPASYHVMGMAAILCVQYGREKARVLYRLLRLPGGTAVLVACRTASQSWASLLCLRYISSESVATPTCSMSRGTRTSRVSRWRRGLVAGLAH